MTETTALGLPLLQPAQAQKHVTVNEALSVLDGLVQLRIASATVTTPPAAVEGMVYSVPGGAGGDWAGQDGRLALAQGGGWTFVTPQVGWHGWLIDAGHAVTFDGVAWQGAPVSSDVHGAALRFQTVSFDHALGSGGVSITGTEIPAGSMIHAVSARVVSEITGSLSSWRLGDGGQDSRYGNGMGLAVGSYAQGLLGAPMTVYSDTPLVVTANGGAFAGGMIRIAAHVLTLELPQV